MFNWFKRNKDKKTETPSSTESQPLKDSQEIKQEQEESKEITEPDYLSWAKSAYTNIQKHKQPLKSEVESVNLEGDCFVPRNDTPPNDTPPNDTPPNDITQNSEVPTISPELAEGGADLPLNPQVWGLTTSDSPTIGGRGATSDSPTIGGRGATSDSPTIGGRGATSDSPTIGGRGATPSELGSGGENVPVWMQKSDRLDVLKETAIETEEEEVKQGIDEDFIWSAQVLANEGRNPENVTEEEFNWLKKLRQGLGKTRRNVINQLKSIIGQGPLNQDAVTEIEALLLSADVGVEATDYVIETLQNKLREEALPPEEAIAYLKTILQEILDKPLAKLTNPEFVPEPEKLNIWLLTGVNGAGKTTTIGKLANLVNKSGYNCVIAAADTFRAAAVEQVKVWGERTNTLVIANPGQNTDPAAVVYDGINAALSRKSDVLLIDTAGRLQNKKNLMEELAKIRRIIDKKASNAKVESLLVLDATLGQNGLRQAQVFSEAAQLTGVVLTKLDGTAKGGVALAVSQQLDLPIRFIGAGEGIEDLRPFSSYEFVEALLC